MVEDQYYTSYHLLSAVREGKVKTVRELLKSFSLSYSREWARGYVLLRDALENKHTEIAKLLLIKGSKVNSGGKYPNSPLHFAATIGDIDIVQMLLDRGAKINAQNKLGDTPLHNAVKSKKLEIVELLINRGADVNTSNRKNLIPLYVAIQSNAKEITTLLLSRAAASVSAKEPHSTTILHDAANRGFFPIVEYLVKHGAYNNSTYTCESPQRYTPIQLAIVNKREKVFKLLLECEADIDAENKFGKTILNFAVEKGQSVIVEHILKRCPDVNNKSNRSALNIAVHGNGAQYKKIVKILLEYGFSVNPEHRNNSKLLHAAVQKGYLTIVEELLKYSTDVNILCNSTSINDSMLLHVATKYKQVEVAKLLISYEADVNAQDKTGNTPIYYAIENVHLKMINLLLTNKASVKDNPELLNTAVKKNCIEIIEILLQHGADINASDKYGITALHCTASDKCVDEYTDANNINEDIAKLLLSRGANVNAQTNSGKTILDSAIYDGNVKVVELLLEYNVDVNSTYKNDRTPLHLCAEEGDEVISKMLLNNGANINAKQKDGTTALHIATQYGHEELVELLLKCGARIDSKTKKGTTPLHIAAETGYLEIVELLLKFGADIDAKNEHGETALHIASTEEYTDIVIALLDHGSDVTITTEYSYTALDIAKDGIDLFYSRYCPDDSDSDIFDHSIIDHEAIAHILKCHMIKLKTANLYACNQNLLSITISDDKDLSYFQLECEGEIASMKSEKIDANISFYNILTKGISQLAIYAGNESVVQVLKSNDYKRKFPLYASTISTHFRNGERRKELLEQGAKIFHFFFNFLRLPHVCAERIFNYLSDEDLRTLMDACKPISRYQQS